MELTDEEIWDIINKVEQDKDIHPENYRPISEYKAIAKAQLTKAQKHYKAKIETIRTEITKISLKLDDREKDLIEAKREERERILKEVGKYYRDEGGLDLHFSWSGIVIYEEDWQALKGEGKC